MQKIEINKKISIFYIQDRDLFTTLIPSIYWICELIKTAARWCSMTKI